MQKTGNFFFPGDRGTQRKIFFCGQRLGEKKDKEKNRRKERKKKKKKNVKHRPSMVLSHTDPNLEGSRPWQLSWPCARLGGQTRLHPGRKPPGWRRELALV